MKGSGSSAIADTGITVPAEVCDLRLWYVGAVVATEAGEKCLSTLKADAIFVFIPEDADHMSSTEPKGDAVVVEMPGHRTGTNAGYWSDTLFRTFSRTISELGEVTRFNPVTLNTH